MVTDVIKLSPDDSVEEAVTSLLVPMVDKDDNGLAREESGAPG